VRCNAIARRIRQLFPGLGGITAVERWAGLRPATPSNVPIIGRTRLRSCFSIPGHGTLGWTLACGSAKALADLVSGTQPEVAFRLPWRKSESLFLDIRGLRYHVRRWPGTGRAEDGAAALAGMDVSASFQFVVDALRGEWDIYAPDWRGYGLTDRGKSDCYWFPDYIADLDFLLREISGGEISSGTASAAMSPRCTPESGRSGSRGWSTWKALGLAATRPGQAPERYARWLDELHEPPRLRPYRNFQELAERLQQGNRRLTPERAEFLARHWGRETEQGEVVLRGAAPAHKIVNPVLYRYEEVHGVLAEGRGAGALGGCGRIGKRLKRLGLSAGRTGRTARRVPQPALRDCAAGGPYAAPMTSLKRWPGCWRNFSSS